MATNFPASLDTLTNPSGSNTLSSPSHASQHGNANDAIEAIQAKVGVDNSAVATSLDYKVRVWNPTGEISMWATGSAPTGWLICDGSAISRTTYAALFAVIGTVYGAGDGSTTFNLPNLKGRVVVGRDSADADWDTLGETRGSKTHTLTISEMPVHSHTQNAHNHSQVAHNHSQNAHNHLLYLIATSSDGSHRHEFTDAGTNSVARTTSTGTANTSSTTQVTDYTEYAGTHSHTGYTVDSTATNIEATATNVEATATNNNTGSGVAHNNIQPSIVLNFIIRH
jgi:microcystin-dependent protein